MVQVCFTLQPAVPQGVDHNIYCMYVCMHVCMSVCKYIYILNTHTHTDTYMHLNSFLFCTCESRRGCERWSDSVVSGRWQQGRGKQRRRHSETDVCDSPIAPGCCCRDGRHSAAPPCKHPFVTMAKVQGKGLTSRGKSCVFRP